MILYDDTPEQLDESAIAHRVGQAVEAIFNALRRDDAPREVALIRSLRALEALQEQVLSLREDNAELLRELQALTNTRR